MIRIDPPRTTKVDQFTILGFFFFAFKIFSISIAHKFYKSSQNLQPKTERPRPSRVTQRREFGADGIGRMDGKTALVGFLRASGREETLFLSLGPRILTDSDTNHQVTRGKQKNSQPYIENGSYFYWEAPRIRSRTKTRTEPVDVCLGAIDRIISEWRTEGPKQNP
jgi:hypothetical protein